VKLPNAHLAFVDMRKVTDYLLNAAHPDNGGKASFFASLGYGSAMEAAALIDGLRKIAETGNVIGEEESEYGQKYIVDGLLVSHTDKSWHRATRTVWIVERRHSVSPRLVTAYPREDQTK
jgi:hypothetical protein